MIGAVMRPALTPYASRIIRMQGYRMNRNAQGDTTHFGVTSKQHRIINGVASILFLAGACFWGASELQEGKEIVSTAMAAPTLTGLGSLVTLTNAIIPVDDWHHRLQRRRERRNKKSGGLDENG